MNINQVICNLHLICEEAKLCGGAKPHNFCPECGFCPREKSAKCIPFEKTIVKVIFKHYMSDTQLVRHIRQMVMDFGPGFHPETKPTDYSPSLSILEVCILNHNLTICYPRLGDKIYKLITPIQEWQLGD